MQIRPDSSLPFHARPTDSKSVDRQLDEEHSSRLGQQLHKHQQQRLQDMQASVAKLQELKKNSSPKKLASQRAAMLKQRLEMLKSLMSKLPPGDYKALAQELKQIAKELAALSKQLGKTSSATISAPLAARITQAATGDSVQLAGIDTDSGLAEATAAMVNTAVAPVVELAQDDMPEVNEAESDVLSMEAETATSTVESEISQQTQDSSLLNKDKLRLPGHSDSQDEDDRALRTVLAQSKKLLKEVLALLKAKHRGDDKETRKIFAGIERDLEQIDQQLEQLDSSAEFHADPIPASSPESGGFIDISV